MDITVWLRNNYIEVFGAVTGIIYVFLEIRQNIWLWPLGIVTSAVYIWVFFTSKFYADMSLQVYYLAISILGWYWWARGGRMGEGENGRKGDELAVTHLTIRIGLILLSVFIFLFIATWYVLMEMTDSPVPAWDAFITSLSVVATWLLARKIYEHWYLWIVVNSVSAVIFFARGLYPTVILYIIYGLMSFVGLVEWKKGMRESGRRGERGEREKGRH